MPECVFLSGSQPLVRKVAGFLLEDRPAAPAGDVVLVSTSGAARRLEERLTQSGTSQRPVITTPMDFLGAMAGENVARRIDCMLAWIGVIEEANQEDFPEILGGFADLSRSSSARRIAASMLELCALLAEAALTPASPEIKAACPLEEQRWVELDRLYRSFVSRLERTGLRDPNLAKIRTARSGTVTPDVKRIVVAAVADLNRLGQQYLESVERKGIPVVILTDAPDHSEGSFDPWGRPIAEIRTQAKLDLSLADMSVMADFASEAEAAAEVMAAGRESTTLCVAEPALIPFLEQSLQSRGIAAYDPQGTPLVRHEAAALVTNWFAFCDGKQFDPLRALAQNPPFLDMLWREARLGVSDVLAGVDALTGELLFESWPDAVAEFSGGLGEEPSQARSRAGALVFAILPLLARFDAVTKLKSLSDFISAACGKNVPSALAENVEAMLRALAAGHDPAVLRDVLCAEFSRVSLYSPRKADEVELHGWLEAHWLEESSIIVSGCTEGILPSSVQGHAFLPDSARVVLGLQTNRERFARDIYLMDCLIRQRAAGSVRLTLSRVAADGEPAKPSRMLFRCGDDQLPERIGKLFGGSPPRRRSPARDRAWLLELPRISPPASMSVTGFKEYLNCPLRYYLGHVVRMDEFAPEKREMDARDFGTVFHEVLECFANDKEAREYMDAGRIERYVVDVLDRTMVRHFGSRLSLLLRVQKRSMEARLGAFARIQAAERAAGWVIQQGEFRFSGEDTILLGNIAVKASLDRVEIHERTGQLRVLDYKTFANAKSPEATHFDSPESGLPILPEAEISRNGRPKRWKDLQLPLYRALTEHRWPDQPVAAETGYFLLPARVEDSRIDRLELSDEDSASARACAEAVASRVASGIFWPPATLDERGEGYGRLFFDRDPAEYLSAASEEFLQGAP